MLWAAARIRIVQQQATAPAQTALASQRFRVAVLYGHAEMQLLQQTIPGNPEQQTQIFIFQVKQTVFVGNHKITPLKLLYLLIFALSMRF